MCDHCDELREEVAYLRRELGIVRSQDIENRLCVVLGVTKSEAAVLALLYGRRGAVLSKGAMWDVLYAGGNSEPELKIIDVYVCKLRKRLAEDSIATVWGKGYTLTALGLAQVDAAMAMAPEDIERPEPVQCRTPKARGIGAIVPILRRMRQGPCDTNALKACVVAERQYQVSSVVAKLVRDGRADCVGIRKRGTLNTWSITPAGLAYLAHWEELFTQKVAA